MISISRKKIFSPLLSFLKKIFKKVSSTMDEHFSQILLWSRNHLLKKDVISKKVFIQENSFSLKAPAHVRPSLIELPFSNEICSYRSPLFLKSPLTFYGRFFFIENMFSRGRSFRMKNGFLWKLFPYGSRFLIVVDLITSIRKIILREKLLSSKKLGWTTV